MKKSSAYNLLFILSCIISGSMPVTAQVLLVSAKQQWLETSIFLNKDEKFEAAARGTWTNGGGTPQMVGPQGWSSVHISSTLAPGLPLGALIGKVGDKIFLIGDQFQGTSPAAGNLALAMNDNDFSDNEGTMRVTLTFHQVKINGTVHHEFPKADIAFIAPDKFLALLQSSLSDGKVQLSQTGEGTPLSVKSANGGIVNSMSYVSFGSTLNAFGVNDIDIPLPGNEWSPEQLKNLGGLTIFLHYFVTTGLVFCDRFRYLVNNIHAHFGSDLSVTLGNNEIILDLSLHCPDPAIRGEGNGYTSVPFGIPIPLGWEDGLCPDIAIKDLGLTIHLVPNVAADGTLHFNDPTIDVRGTLNLNNFDWLPIAQDVKDKAMGSFKKNVEDALRQPTTKKGLESGFFGVFPLFTGRKNENLSEIGIDHTGILLTFKS